MFAFIGDYLLVAALIALVACVLAQVDGTSVWMAVSGALLVGAMLDRQAGMIALVGLGGCLLLKVLVEETFGRRPRPALTLDILMTEDEEEASRAFFG